MQDEVSTAIAGFTEMWRNGELENSDSVTQGMLGAVLHTDSNIDNIAGKSNLTALFNEKQTGHA